MRNEQAQLQSHIITSQDDARHALDEFTYTVAHDLNGPLRRIINFTHLLEKKFQTILDPQAMHYLEIIAENGHMAQARLSGLLQYSRLNATPVTYEAVDCKEIINNCLQQLKADIENRKALIHVSPMPHVAGNCRQLELLFYCLISNALKFCNDHPDISIAAQRGDNGWVFSVCDRGIGIAPEHYDEIFSIFHRLHHDHEYPGNGIGLALAKRIAELHHGDIRVESYPGRGATFYVTLPDHNTI
jgi:light-regulated signal transduction histidine kinase (bacteriophytochrome)